MSAGETAQGSGVTGGTSQVFHIGTPSGSENTGSSIFQSIPSQRSSIPSHPTSSPISFGPSTPVMSASAAPAPLQEQQPWEKKGCQSCERNCGKCW